MSVEKDPRRLHLIFDYVGVTHETPVGALVDLLDERGFGVNHWSKCAPRPAEPLPVDRLLKLMGSRAATQVEEAMDRVLAELEEPDRWASGLSEVLLTMFAAVLLKDVLVIQAAGGVHESNSEEREVLEILVSSSNRGFVWALAFLADNFARRDQQVEAIPSLYEMAIRAVPRPNLHNELGALLVARAGVLSDGIDGTDDLVLSALSFGYEVPELLPAEGDWGAVVPDHRTRLVTLAIGSRVRPDGRAAVGRAPLPLQIDHRGLRTEVGRTLQLSCSASATIMPSGPRT